MKPLEELKALGVKELQVTNGQAVAVNPYSCETYDRLEAIRFWNFKDANLTPLPCSESVKEGRYSIDRFSEQEQFYFEGGAKFGPARWVDCTKDRDYSNRETRTVLVLSEPVSECCGRCDGHNDICIADMKGEPVEKSKVPEEYPGKEYQELFEHLHDEHGLILLQSEMDDIISIVKKFLTSNPKQYL